MADVASLDRLKVALAARYRIERALGAGGMATVYLARDLKHDRDVALKVLRPELAAVLGADRFLAEIRITAALDHPHILTLIDSGETDGFLWYILPYVRGESLRDCLNREGQLSLDDALAITRQVAGALDYAHRQGVIHRDIKPENILLFEGEAMLVDFGIALAVGAAAGTRLTESGLSLGTPQYMSPEQATGARQLDARSDLYSLGAVVYEMLAGEPPHSGPTAQAVIAKLLTDRPTSLRTLRDTVPEAVEAAVARALAKIPADRPASAGAFAAALAAEKPVGRQHISRKIVAIGLGLAAFAVLVALVVHFVLRTGRAALVANRVVVTVFENQTGDTSLSTLGRIAADWFTDGMLRAEVFEVTPTQAALRAWQFAQDEVRAGRARDPVQAIAEETGAGLVISGSFLRNGDSLTLQAQITDARTDRLISPQLRVTGSAQDPMRAVDLLRERIMGAATAALQGPPALALAGVSSHSPNFLAYKAFMDGFELFQRTDWTGAAERFYRAAALDTLFAVPLLWAGVVELNLGRNWRADSLADVLTPARDRLSRFEHYHLDYIRAYARADWKAAQIANQGLSRIMPQSGYTANVGWLAYNLNRPREGIEWLQKLDPERLPMGQWHPYWLFLTQMHHALGDYGAELRAAQRGRRLFPDLPATLWPEIRARAARGDYQRAVALLEERLSLPTGPGGSYLSMMENAAREFAAHGYGNHADNLRQRAISAYRTQPSAMSPAFGTRADVARLFFGDGQWQEAHELFTALLQQTPTSIEFKGNLGVIAARRGDSTQARQIGGELEALQTPFLNGNHTLWRARIATARGERAIALRLLQTAIQEGVAMGTWLHADPTFASLRGEAQFQEILRPKG